MDSMWCVVCKMASISQERRSGIRPDCTDMKIWRSLRQVFRINMQIVFKICAVEIKDLTFYLFSYVKIYGKMKQNYREILIL